MKAARQFVRFAYSSVGVLFAVFGATASADSVSYTYDDLNRLESVSYNSGQQVIDYTYDAAGNMLSRTVSVAEQLAPVLDVTAPADGATFMSPNVVVSGTASDAGQGDSGITEVTLNGARASNDTAAGADTATWSLDVGPSLVPGSNAVSIRAVDGSPWLNDASAILTLVYLPPIADTNMNGLPDIWENANAIVNPFGDDDLDGISNINEYKAGTNPQDQNSAPEGANGLNYVLFRDHFDDSQHDDRWSLTAVDPGTILTLQESGTELETTIETPGSGCKSVQYQSFATVSATSTVYHGSVQLDGYGRSTLGLVRDNDPDDRIEVVFDGDSTPYVLVRSVDAGVATEMSIDLPSALRASPVDLRVTKNADQYVIYVDYVNTVSVVNPGLGDAALRPYFVFESCAGDSGFVEARADLVEVLLDTDGDGLADTNEDANADGLVDVDESDPSIPDTDGDGVQDGSDNCLLRPNANQRDTDADGYGNDCDTDLDNNGIVNVIDLGLFKSVFFTTDADADFNGDGIVNVVDLGALKLSFFQPAGPSGLRP